MLESEAQAVAAECLIETGTFRGDTIWRFRNRFRKIITIEVQDQLAKLARERFDGYRNIRVIHGDSAKTLSNACVEIDGNCLIYLDGHYSGGFTGLGEEECPVMAEVRTLFSHLKHPFRIIIDDARLFGTDPAYPTRHDILAFLEKQDGDWRFREENDAFVIWRA